MWYTRYITGVGILFPLLTSRPRFLWLVNQEGRFGWMGELTDVGLHSGAKKC